MTPFRWIVTVWLAVVAGLLVWSLFVDAGDMEGAATGFGIALAGLVVVPIVGLLIYGSLAAANAFVARSVELTRSGNRAAGGGAASGGGRHRLGTVVETTPVLDPSSHDPIGYAEPGARFLVRRIEDAWVLVEGGSGERAWVRRSHVSLEP